LIVVFPFRLLTMFLFVLFCPTLTQSTLLLVVKPLRILSCLRCLQPRKNRLKNLSNALTHHFSQLGSLHKAQRTIQPSFLLSSNICTR
jgi:hypothetical protein